MNKKEHTFFNFLRKDWLGLMIGIMSSFAIKLITDSKSGIHLISAVSALLFVGFCVYLIRIRSRVDSATKEEMEHYFRLIASGGSIESGFIPKNTKDHTDYGKTQSKVTKGGLICIIAHTLLCALASFILLGFGNSQIIKAGELKEESIKNQLIEIEETIDHLTTTTISNTDSSNKDLTEIDHQLTTIQERLDSIAIYNSGQN